MCMYRAPVYGEITFYVVFTSEQRANEMTRRIIQDATTTTSTAAAVATTPSLI